MKIEDLPKSVINLPHRIDRLKMFKREMRVIGFSGIMLQKGIIDGPPYKGIGMAHLKAMEQCFNKCDVAVIMEDDLVLPGRHKTVVHINLCLENAPKDWDILFAGVLNQKGITVYNEYWNKVDDFRGLQFYIITKAAYERIKTNYKCDDHIDKWISENNFKTYIMNPVCALQRDGFSDNVKYNTKYFTLYSKRFNILKP